MFNFLKPGFVTVPNFQQRLLLGIGSFVGMLLLVGWIAINEPARMEVFTQQFNGRSIENGATLFLNNCATCHGVDGKGIAERAPALNNPMLFLKENPAKAAQAKVDELTKAQADVQAEIDVYNKRVQDFAAANEQLKTVAAGSPEETELKTKITSLTAQIQNFDLAAAQRRYDAYITDIKAAQTELNRFQALGWDAARDPRLAEVKWNGTLAGYIESTIISGRPVSSLYWPQPMPAWGQEAGGPLRPDEIKNLTNYILNFEDMALQLSPADVFQSFKLPGGTAPVVDGVGTDVAAILPNIAGGDAVAGQTKYTSFGCAGCHNGTTAPAVAGTYTRVVNDRLTDPANADKTAEHYLVESILLPNEFVAPNFTAGVMPQDFGDRLTEQDLKDIVAYLMSQR